MEQKRAVISAAGSGIGRAIAEALLADGWQIFACDRDAAALAELATVQGDLLCAVADVADPASVEAFYAGIDDGIDLLVNNAGIAGPTAPLDQQPIDGWRETIDVNLNGAFYMARHAIPLLRLRAPGASIINMASNAALFGCPLRSPYVASKWALIGLTKTLAMELGPEGIRVNAICPASVEGPRIERVIAADAAARGMTPQQVEAEYKSQSSLRTFARPEDIVAMVRFLASPAGERISGQSIAIDGHTESLSLRMEG